MNFFSAFYDDEFVLQDECKVIAHQYLKSWFLIDFVAIIPFWAFESNEPIDSQIVVEDDQD